MHLAGIPFNLGMGHDLAFTGILKTGFLYSYLLQRWLTLAASDSASFLFVGSVGPLQMLISKAVLSKLLLNLIPAGEVRPLGVGC